MATTQKEWLIRLALLSGSLLFGVCALEGGYRVRLVLHPYKPLTRGIEQFSASSIVFGLHHPEIGVSYAPGTSHQVVTVTVDGRVTWAPAEPIAAANNDGFLGRTTRDEYSRAAVRVVAIGDSFTNWRQDGDTWPDLAQALLTERLGREVAILNDSRGGYGVLQMFDLAAHVLPELRPDLAVIAFISDDLSRGRWWVRATPWEGYIRPLQSPSPTSFDPSIAIDEYIVDPRISPEWAAMALADPAKGQPLLGELIRQYERIKEDFHRARGLRPIERSPWSLSELYLWNRLTTGLPVRDHVASIPRLSIEDLGADARFVEAVGRVRALGIPILLLHLPNAIELAQERPGWDGALVGSALRDRRLAESLERVTGLRILLLEHETEGVTIPAKIDLLPHNGHPSHDGLALYAELAARVIARHPAVTGAGPGGR